MNDLPPIKKLTPEQKAKRLKKLMKTLSKRALVEAKKKSEMGEPAYRFSQLQGYEWEHMPIEEKIDKIFYYLISKL